MDKKADIYVVEETQKEFELYAEGGVGSTGHVGSHELLSELKLLLNDYFVGTITDEKHAIKVEFLNGQSFLIKVETYV